MKAAITRGVEGRRLREVLPADLRHRIPTGVDKGELYTVVLFPHTREDVVRSSAVEKALRRVESGRALVAVGGTFTTEARSLLAERGALVISQGDFFWTDASYKVILAK